VLRIATEDVAFSYPLPATGRVVVGRGRDADLQIDDLSLSRRHAALSVADKLAVEDLGSANGTRIGGARIEPGVRVELAVDQVVQLGSVLVVVQSTSWRGQASPPAVRETAFVDQVAPVLQRVAASTINVLLLGETGVGKEVIARSLHASGPRTALPFVAVNCAAISEQLLESELFGHERGAFTGAYTTKVGVIESAHGGTLFLDELGELPLALQAKLLRVLEDRAVQRVGAVEPTPVDIRIIAASNRDLEADSSAGRFRVDLYFRIAGFSLVIPPLRDRPGEIPALARRFAAEAAARAGHAAPELTALALARLAEASWPGNVRQLRNVIERAVVLNGARPIAAADLQLEVPRFDAPGGGAMDVGPLRDHVRRLERKRIVDTLERCGGNQSRAARELGISRPTLSARMEAFGLPRPRKRD
jgi:two-component system, NtrC family, response regulator AtoC